MQFIYHSFTGLVFILCKLLPLLLQLLVSLIVTTNQNETCCVRSVHALLPLEYQTLGGVSNNLVVIIAHLQARNRLNKINVMCCQCLNTSVAQQSYGCQSEMVDGGGQ